MKERPILMCAEMVLATIEDRKTNTRRIVKYIPMLGEPSAWCAASKAQEPGWVSIVGDYRRFCPYGVPGDRLWVRETFSLCGHDGRYVLFKDGGQKFKSGDYASGLKQYNEGAFDHIKWKPSIFMPRWASRITLEIVSVGVERLQDITEGDAIEEGITYGQDHDYIGAFRKLWNGLNEKRGFGWDKNPWLWRIEFKRIPQP